MKKEKKWDLPLIIFLCVHFILLIFIYLFIRQTFHSDEIWSYNIANDSVASSVFKDNNGKEINIGKWTSGKVLHNAVTVQKDERFHFEIPYKNAVADYHPPLSFFMIHLMSSFAPDTFSWWFFIPFNILAMLICDFYLYQLLKLYKIPWGYALFLCAIMDFCDVGIAMTVYLRMYTLLAAFGLMILYYSLKIYKQEEISRKDVLKLIVVNVLGGLTCYEYFVFAFFIAAFTCIMLLGKKAWKLFFKYGFSMLGGVAIALALFPEAIRDMLSNFGGEGFSSWENYPYLLQFKMLLSILIQNIFGVYMNPFEPFFLGMVPNLLIILYAVVILAPIVYVIRSTSLIKNVLRKIKEIGKFLAEEWKEKGSLLFLCLTTFFAFLLVMNNSISVYDMASQSLRYLFIVEPIMILVVGVLFYSLINVFIKNQKVCVSIFGIGICVMIIFSNLTGTPLFVENGGKSTGTQISDIKDSKIIIVVFKANALERLATVIDESNDFLLVNYEDLDNYEEEIRKVGKQQKLHLIIEENVYGKYMDKSSYRSMSEATALNDFDQDKNDLYQKMKNEKTAEIQNYLKSIGVAEDYKYIGTMRMLNEGFDLIEMK